jgi:hypothetical protein
MVFTGEQKKDEKKPGPQDRVRKPYCCHTPRHPLREEKRGVLLADHSSEMLHQYPACSVATGTNLSNNAKS